MGHWIVGSNNLESSILDIHVRNNEQHSSGPMTKGPRFTFAMDVMVSGHSKLRSNDFALPAIGRASLLTATLLAQNLKSFKLAF